MEQPASMVIRSILGTEGIITLPEDGLTWPCFISHLPDGDEVRNDAASLLDSTGIKQGRLMTGEVLERAGVQLQLRSLDYRPGREKLHAIVQKFDSVVRLGIDAGIHFYFIDAIRRGTVIPLGIEEGTKRRHLFSLNIDFEVTEDDPYQPSFDSLYNILELIEVDFALYFGEE